MTTKQRRLIDLIDRMRGLGFELDEITRLRRIERTLQRWGELECGNSNDYASYCITRDETTGKPYMEVHPNAGKTHRYPVADRERGALRRLAAIMANHPDYVAYHQTDPRGCALHIVAKADIPADSSIDRVYNRGLAVWS